MRTNARKSHSIVLFLIIVKVDLKAQDRSNDVKMGFNEPNEPLILEFESSSVRAVKLELCQAIMKCFISTRFI